MGRGKQVSGVRNFPFCPLKLISTCRRHVYPKSRALGCANTGPQLSDIEKRVKAVLDTIDYGCGNVYRMVAEDLAAPAAEEELALLSGL